jgi:hypothetical protein
MIQSKKANIQIVIFYPNQQHIQITNTWKQRNAKKIINKKPK